VVLAAVAAVATAGVLAYLLSPGYGVAPNPGLRQLDLLYLDEPAAGLDQLGVTPGQPAVVVFCEASCALPQVEGAQLVRSRDPALAARYALTTSGRVGPGYALIDPQGRLRYRTFDPRPASMPPRSRSSSTPWTSRRDPPRRAQRRARRPR